MKRYLLLILMSLPVMVLAQTEFKGSDYIFYNKVSIGKTNGVVTSNDAWLEIGKDSTNKGLRLPRVLDTANVSGATNGLIIYQKKDSAVYYRNGFGWRRISDGSGYLRLIDSTTYYYPLKSNPKGYLTSEADPIANAKTITLRAGTGIILSNSTPQAVGSNPIDTISANNMSPIWNANALRGAGVSANVPTSGQFLIYNGAQWIPTTVPTAGTVTSVGLSLPTDIFNISGSPVTSSGTLTGTVKNQFANLIWASPNGLSGAPAFRSLTNTDLPISGVTSGTYGNDTSFNSFTVNSKGIITNAATNTLTLDKVLRGGNTTTRTIYFLDTTGNIFWGAFTDYTKIKFASTGDNTGTSNLVFEYGDDAGNHLKEGFIFIRDSSNSVGPKRYDTTLRINGEGVIASKSLWAPAQSYTTGGITPLGRNNSTGRFELISTGSYPISLKKFYADETNSASVMSYTIPSTYLANSGDEIKVIYSGTFAATGTTHTVGINISSNNISLSNGTTSGGTWQIESTIIRVNNTTVRVTTNIILDNTGVSTNLTHQSTDEITGLNLSSTGLPISVSIAAPTTNITAKLGSIVYYPAAP